MSRKTTRKAIAAAIAAITLLGIAGCGTSAQQPGAAEAEMLPTNVVVVGGEVSNQPILRAADIEGYFGLAVESGGLVDIVVADGSPRSSIGGAGSASSDADSKKREEIENGVISEALAAAYQDESLAVAEETDLIAALDLASRDFNAAANGGENVVVVVHSGLQTSGVMRFQDGGLLGAEPEEVADAASDELPDLSNVSNLVWLNCAATSGDQEPLSNSQARRLKEIWKAVLAEAGCESVEFRDLPCDAPAEGGELPSVSTVEVERTPVVVDSGAVRTYTFSSEALMFLPDSSDFADESEASEVLSEVADALIADPESSAVVQASTASYPWDEGYAVRLSQERACATADALSSLGVEPSRISAEGLGFSDPEHVDDIDPSTGLQVPELAAQNRKVKITVE